MGIRIKEAEVYVELTKRMETSRRRQYESESEPLYQNGGILIEMEWRLEACTIDYLMQSHHSQGFD